MSIILSQSGQIAKFFDRLDTVGLHRSGRPGTTCRLFWWTIGYSLMLTGMGVYAGGIAIGTVFLALKEERMQPSKDQNLNESILLLTLDYWILESMH